MAALSRIPLMSSQMAAAVSLRATACFVAGLKTTICPSRSSQMTPSARRGTAGIGGSSHATSSRYRKTPRPSQRFARNVRFIGVELVGEMLRLGYLSSSAYLRSAGRATVGASTRDRFGGGVREHCEREWQDRWTVHSQRPD